MTDTKIASTLIVTKLIASIHGGSPFGRPVLNQHTTVN
jgi:hypothetical protein